MKFENLFGGGRKEQFENRDGKEVIAQELLRALEQSFPNTSFTRADAERTYAQAHGIDPKELKEHQKVVVLHALNTLSHSSHRDLFFTGEVYWITPYSKTTH